MTYRTRRELKDAVISEYNRAVKGQAEQLYSCKAWYFEYIEKDKFEIVLC